MWCWQSVVIYIDPATNGVTSGHPDAANGSTASLYGPPFKGAAGAVGAEQADDGAGLDGEGDPVDGDDGVVALAESLPESLDLDGRLAVRRRGPIRGRSRSRVRRARPEVGVVDRDVGRWFAVAVPSRRPLVVAPGPVSGCHRRR